MYSGNTLASFQSSNTEPFRIDVLKRRQRGSAMVSAASLMSLQGMYSNPVALFVSSSFSIFKTL